MVALPCSLLELSPLNEILSGNLVHSIALIPFETFQLYLEWDILLSVKTDCHLQ